MKKNMLGKLAFAVFALFLVGCTEEVPPGHVGMIMEPGGVKGKVLEPGFYSCYNRDRMVVVESREEMMTEDLAVLCSDDLNFKFQLNVRCRTRNMNADRLKELVRRQGAKIKWEKQNKGVLRFQAIYRTYVQPDAVSIARTIVSKFQTTQIRDAREKIQKAIQESVIKACADGPIEITGVVTSNFDYPDVITKAVEKKRQKEIEIEEERAKQAMELLKADNRLKIAEKLKIVRVAEAQAEAAYNQILAKSLTPQYLLLRQRENERLLYGRSGPGDKVIVIPSDTAITPMIDVSGPGVRKQK